jgi:thioredoxin reductase (NADPH)
MATVKVYGADWCPQTTHTRKFLDQQRVAYEYIDIDEDTDGAAWVASHNDGKEKKPTLDVDGDVVTTPSDAQLARLLREKGLLA